MYKNSTLIDELILKHYKDDSIKISNYPELGKSILCQEREMEILQPIKDLIMVCYFPKNRIIKSIINYSLNQV